MLRGIYTATCGMLIDAMRQDVTANNIANADTTAFKVDRMAVRVEPEWSIHRVDDRKLERIRLGIDPMPYVGELGTGVAIAERYTDHAQGQIVPTGNNLDVALDGEGFFMVLTDEGPRFTRAGTFRLNEAGVLVDGHGRELAAITPNVAVNPNTHVIMEGGEPGITTTVVRMDATGDYRISLDGQVFRGTEPLYKLVVVKFDDPSLLVKTGDNYYAYGGPNIGNFAYETRTIQGSLEQSNVKAVDEMVRMITLLRSYEANQKIIQTHDEALGRAVNNLGRLG